MNPHKIYRLIGLGLFLNNLTGILLNLHLTLASVIFGGIGLPGIVFFMMYADWAFWPKARKHSYYIKFSTLMLAYNLTIAYIFRFESGDEFLQFFYPGIFPLVNILLCGILLTVSIYHAFNARKDDAVYPETMPVTEPGKTIIDFFSVFCIVIVVFLLSYLL